jgi:hypothetical protein
MGEWIPIAERSPDREGSFLVWDDFDKKILFLAYRPQYDIWTWGGYYPARSRLTHWMELPSPPEGVKTC